VTPLRIGGKLAGLAAGAAVLFALFMLRPMQPAHESGGARPAARMPEPQAGGSLDIREAEAEYIRATTQLLQALNARRGSMSPAARKEMAELEANVTAIDAALGEVKRALDTDPRNRNLNKMLASTHRKKIDLLLKLIRLSSQI
jgi:hypothetical protein